MTTSEPQAGRRDDDAREHRSIGQRIRDAVLGEEPGDNAPGGRTADTGYAEPDQERTYADPDRSAAAGFADPTPTDRDVTDRDVTDRGLTDRGLTDRGGATGYDATPSGRDVAGPAAGQGTGFADPADARDSGQEYPARSDRGVAGDDVARHDLTGHGADGGPSAGAAPVRGFDAFGAESAGTDSAAGYAEAPRGDSGYAGTDRGAYTDARSGDADGGAHAGASRDTTSGDDTGTRGVGGAPASGGSAYSADDPGRRVAPESYGAGQAVADPVADDVAQDGTPRDVTGTGYGDEPRGAGVGDDSRGTATPGDRDFVTSSYDPDRDTGYDPHAAGTAATEPVGAGDVRTDVRSDDHDTRGYEPAADTGYVDERRADVDRTTGDRDADYDTGRVDTGRVDTGRVDTDRVDTDRVGTDHDSDRDTTHHAAGLGAAAAVAAGGAGVAAGVAGAHHRDSDARDADDHDARFSAIDDTSAVDDTSPVDATSTGHGSSDATLGAPAPTATPAGTGDTAADQRAEAVADEADESDHGGRERLVPADRADDYSSRWDALKGDFVDEPRRAVAQADDLVGELLDEIQRLFSDQRRDLEQGFDHDRASTEDLRLALRRYRSFFDRLLSF